VGKNLEESSKRTWTCDGGKVLARRQIRISGETTGVGQGGLHREWVDGGELKKTQQSFRAERNRGRLLLKKGSEKGGGEKRKIETQEG